MAVRAAKVATTKVAIAKHKAKSMKLAKPPSWKLPMTQRKRNRPATATLRKTAVTGAVRVVAAAADAVVLAPRLAMLRSNPIARR